MNRTYESPVVHPAVGVLDRNVAEAVHSGLTARAKYLPSWLFYDAAGSHLFDRITELPEYYLTRVEREIFHRNAEEMIARAAGSERLTIIELGAGSASKTLVLLRALVARQGTATYVPVDVSSAALQLAQNNVRKALPHVDVQPVQAEYMRDMSLTSPGDCRCMVLYIGSSIGNFDPQEAIELLQRLRAQLEPGDALLLGTDMVKDLSTLLPAYNDAADVTAAFNKNILVRLNRELAADFDPDAFDHRAIWNREHSRIEMHLVSRSQQAVRLQALEFSIKLAAGESIHTENSYKFTPAGVEDLFESAGFIAEQSWYDEHHWFGVHLARATDRLEFPLESDELEPGEQVA
ncbi:MAG TPA: L-histidine N(alpha)-methyltransferase [Acidobacteriaceae bacterium]|nr:L-histidine N(alpha)-methyltransferase [Acidobacteriaceae bacterium]